MDKLEQAEELLTTLYWQMMDNHDDIKQCKRLDTILGKIRELRELRERM